MLLRSLLVMTISSRPLLLGSALKLLTFLIQTRLPFLKVNHNPILHGILKRTFYDHFCAGENGVEVRSTVRSIKDMGFKGVILTYAKEIVTDPNTREEKGVGAQNLERGGADVTAKISSKPEIESWKLGVLSTAEMIGEDDYLALKLTGAGASVTSALKTKTDLPDQMTKALEEVCSKAIEHGARILVDAEQQSVQPGIDIIALHLMKKFNKQETAVVYNTYQAYLKSTSANLIDHMHLANEENFTLGVKLVRGAYIGSESRHLINDTKEDTDQSYDSIASGLLSQNYGGMSSSDKNSNFPSVNLFLATHNKESVLSAHALHREILTKTGKNPLVPIEYGQLLGMADGVSCQLLQLGQQQPCDVVIATAPRVYKCLSWGTLADCLSYLLRRAVENRDAAGRTRSEYMAIKSELKRRMRVSIFG